LEEEAQELEQEILGEQGQEEEGKLLEVGKLEEVHREEEL
jgi:hypothetical protein